MAAPVNWFEVAGPDTAQLTSFYRELLDWQPVDADGRGYHVVQAAPNPSPADGDPPAGFMGGIWDAGTEIGAFAVFYVQVDDVDKSARRAEELGGSVLVSPRPNGPVRFAHIADPAGNRVGIYSPGS